MESPTSLDGSNRRPELARLGRRWWPPRSIVRRASAPLKRGGDDAGCERCDPSPSADICRRITRSEGWLARGGRHASARRVRGEPARDRRISEAATSRVERGELSFEVPSRGSRASWPRPGRLVGVIARGTPDGPLVALVAPAWRSECVVLKADPNSPYRRLFLAECWRRRDCRRAVHVIRRRRAARDCETPRSGCSSPARRVGRLVGEAAGAPQARRARDRGNKPSSCSRRGRRGASSTALGSFLPRQICMSAGTVREGRESTRALAERACTAGWRPETARSHRAADTADPRRACISRQRGDRGGAKHWQAARRRGAFYRPTVLRDVQPECVCGARISVRRR